MARSPRLARPAHSLLLLLLLLLALLTAVPALAQDARPQDNPPEDPPPEGTPPTVTTEDYARAERTLYGQTAPYVYGADVRPTWLPDGRLWYRTSVPEGHTYVLADPAAGLRAPAFDHDRLATALSAAADTTFEARALPLAGLAFSGDARGITFDVRPWHYACDLETYTCDQTGRAEERRTNRAEVVSPDGTRAAFIRDHNLWMRDLETGAETQLTTDGVEHFGYATNNAGWTRSDRPVLLWSPDSKKIATFQHDGRGVGEMVLATTNVGHPRAEIWKYPLPGDSLIFRIHRVVIHLEDEAGTVAPRVVRLQMPPDAHRSTVTDHVAFRGSWADVQWSPDASQLAFVSSSRDHQTAQLRIADPETGAVRDVLEETVDTFYESGYRAVNWRVLFDAGEVLWYSQRTNWGHLYLYDLATGALKRPVTEGPWNVLQLRRLDEDDRTLFVTGAGREPGDPYFQYLYRVGLDGGGVDLVTPDSANHEVEIDPSGRYVVDQYSTPDTPPVTVVRHLEGAAAGDAAGIAPGAVAVELERADARALRERGWQAPVPFTVKARDGETDLYGLLYKPSHFDPSKAYPVINYVYPGPQTGSVGSRSFRPARGDKQALAELGFVVVEVDAMGTPMRSKSFHTAYYGNMGDNGLPDQIAAIRQLAGRHAWIDTSRVGIYGHSGGGFASTAAILRYPDVYHVAVSSAGNHDNRNYEDDWGEKWQGLLERYPDGTTSYDNQANQLVAENLEGKLLLAHGTMDTNVPVYNTLLVVDALIEANKDFDLLLLPNRGHGFAREPYMMRRRWDYFVEHLLGAEPPPPYTFGQLEE